jgi:uncharacterized protein (TIGR00251 family)
LDQGNTDIFIKLLPRSYSNRIVGKEGDVFKVKVTAPPVEGRANKALISLLAKSLKIPKRDIVLMSGKHSRMKMVRIHGLSKEAVMKLMNGD